MKQKIFFLFLIIFSLVQLFPVTQSYALMPLPPGNETLFGENQYYTVTFRGNGEAIVTMKAIITNNNATPLSSVTLHLPGTITAKNVIGYQVIAQPQCVQYSNEPIAKPTCLQYQPPNYQYVNTDTKYQNLSIDQTNNAFSFALPTPIKQNDTGSYLLSYRTFNYTQKNFFGAYDFTFQSLKVADQINALQIGIATDSDLYIKGAKGTVNYDTATTMKSLAVPQAAGGAGLSQRFTDFYNQIGQGTIIKNASNLEPLESYTTKGMYADTGIRLYGQEISTTIIVILGILAIVFTIVTFILRRQKNTKSDKKAGNTKLFWITTGTSFGSVLVASGYTVVMLLVANFLNPNNYYAYGNAFATLLITALSGAVYLFLLFVPAIIMAVKKGLIWGGILLGLTIMWAVIACIILFGVFYLFSNNTTPSPIIRPLMMSGQGTAVPAGAVEKAQ